ncbi:MarR family transcriptional regulator [Allohahella marinimesophila]|uniref:HTH marR-type domain-containing protein n=1 Tax=Allohahella marinimesophila TaxID=1054972 RepID=A0ABP7Q7L1_9GAMM
MTKQHLTISAGDTESGFDGFVHAWEVAERGERKSTKIHLGFEDLPMLLAVINPRRLYVLKTIKQRGALSARTLAATLHRNYRSVLTDTRALERAGLITRSGSGDLQVLFDVIDARLDLI